MRILLFVLFFSLSFSESPKEDSDSILVDFEWGSINPKSVVYSKGTTILNSPVFVYSIKEKDKLNKKMKRMIMEINHLRKRVTEYDESLKILKNHIKAIDEEHAKEKLAMENMIKLHQQTLDSFSKAIERLSKGSGGKKFWDNLRDVVIMYGLARD